VEKRILMNEIKTITAVYFSATGTTKKICRRVAEKISAELGAASAIVDFTSTNERVAELTFGETDLVVFGVPTYAGRVPNVLLPYLTKKISGGGAIAVPVVLYGNRDFDDSLIELRNLLEKDGFHTVAAGAFIGEHSFSYNLAKGRPDEADLSKADDFAARVSALVINADTRDALIGGEPVSVRGETPLRPYYMPRDRNGEPINILKVTPKVSGDSIDCGVCADVCPMGSIDHTNIRIYRGICIKCGACVKKCPKRARYYDDAGYLYHVAELEEMYAERKEPELFGV
jgi:ferredoxin